MGTIVERKSKSGTKHRALVIKKKEGEVVFSKSATFSRKTAANAWIKKVEKDFDAGKLTNRQIQTTVSELIDKVIDTQRKQMGKTKSQVLKTIKLFDVTDFEVASLRPADLVEFANQVAEGEHGPAGRSPSTTANYMSHLPGCLSAWHTRNCYRRINPSGVRGNPTEGQFVQQSSRSEEWDRRPKFGSSELS